MLPRKNVILVPMKWVVVFLKWLDQTFDLLALIVRSYRREGLLRS